MRDYLPEFVKTEEDYKTFVAFMEAFYEYVEQSKGQTGSIRNLRSFQDIDDALDDFINYWQDSLSEHLPTAIVGDKRLSLKKMRDIYLSKGTEASYKLLFRLLFDEDILIRYPGEEVLIASGGDWREYIRLEFTETDGDLFDTEFTTMKGKSSGASGIVERVERTISNKNVLWRVFYSVESKEGDFEEGEEVEFENGSTGTIDEVITGLGDYASDQSLLNTQSGVLHDGFFYQKYSYVVEAGEPTYDEIADDPELLAALGIGIWSWRDIIKKILHPAGLLLFSEFSINTRLSTRTVSLDRFISLVIWSVLNVTIDNHRFFKLRSYKGIDHSAHDYLAKIDEDVDVERKLATNAIVAEINYNYQRTIPHPATKRGPLGNKISEYKHKPVGNKELPDGKSADEFEGVYWDSEGGETSLNMVEELLGGGEDFTFDKFIDGKLSNKRNKLAGDAYIYQRTVS